MLGDDIGLEVVPEAVDIVFLREVTEGMQSSDTVVVGAGEGATNVNMRSVIRSVMRSPGPLAHLFPGPRLGEPRSRPD